MNRHETPLYTTRQIRELEALAIEEFSISESELMVRAGQGAYEVLAERWSIPGRLLVFAGKGNNAGDGYVVARLAATNGWSVSVRYLAEPAELKGAAGEAAKAAIEAGVEVLPFTAGEVYDADVVVDALLGIGISGPLNELALKVVATINAIQAPVLAIDVPSGVHVNTGGVWPMAVHADVTVTFIGLKQGLFTGKAVNHTGEVVLKSLDIPAQAYVKVGIPAERLSLLVALEHLGRRRRTSSKRAYGHVLVIGGDTGMAGAVRMAGEAAYRSGAGLVTVATRAEHVPAVVANRPELMCHPVKSGRDLAPLLARASVVVIGPGLGRNRFGRSLLKAALNSDTLKVVDADALNLLSEKPVERNDWVITPHEGEAARLLGVDVQDIKDDRFAAVRELQKRYGGVSVLKGAGSLVLGSFYPLAVCTAGNPGMASGGMGDVLSGVIAGLMAQGLSPEVAARLGVLVHAMAGDAAAADAGERGLLATDLLGYVRGLLNGVSLSPGNGGEG